MANPTPKAVALASFFQQKPPKTPEDHSHVRSMAWQMDHRLELLNSWNIKPGSRVLELGCGQGDCTIPLADAVGETGHVDAVDPGAPDYGSPWTLSQAQTHLKSTSLGPRIAFFLSTDPLGFLSSLPPDAPPYDYIVLAHCIWYFESPSVLASLVSACIPRTKYLCVAEWSLQASLPASQPHVLTALLLASLEAKRKVATSVNIRSIISPKQITSTILNAKSSGSTTLQTKARFELETEQTSITNEGMLDGYWEVSYNLRTRDKVLGRLEQEGVPEKELGAMSAMFDAVGASVELLDAPEGKEKVRAVRSMDFWVGRFLLLDES